MRTELSNLKRIVIKIGSSIIDLDHGALVSKLCNQINQYLNKNREILIVTSGAISQGMRIMDILQRPKDTKKLQSLAALGQQRLMLMYEKSFSEYSRKTAQVLITHNDINDRVRYLNIKGTLEELLVNKIIPVINENDVVSTEEIKFGDNDNLASMIANLVNADLMIILTDQKGMYNKNPDHSKDAKLINNIYVDQLNDFDSDFSTNSDTGTGGFVTKIQAVKRAALSNTYTVIASGLEDNILNDIFEKDNVGTLFIPSSKKISAKKQWLDTTDNRGCVIIDDGAWNALSNNKSLLLVGVENVEGNFQKGYVIQCKNTSSECIAKGIVNYSSGDVMRMKGMTMNDIKNEYGDEFNKELIHIDNLIIIET